MILASDAVCLADRQCEKLQDFFPPNYSTGSSLVLINICCLNLTNISRICLVRLPLVCICILQKSGNPEWLVICENQTKV